MITIIKHTSLFCLLIYVTSLVNPIYAQSYHFHQYTIEDGLPTDAVYGAMQDRQGYIWIFTEKGLSKFDGYEFKTFTMEEGLPSNDIWDLTEDGQGRIWIQTTSTKLAYVKKDSIKHIKTSGKEILYPRIIYDTSGKIWFWNSAKFYEVNNDTLIIEQQVEATAESDVFQSLGKSIRYLLFTAPNQFIVFVKNNKYIAKQKEGNQTDSVNLEWLDNVLNFPSAIEHRQNFIRSQYIAPDLHYIFTSVGFGKWDKKQKEGLGFSYEEKLPKQKDRPITPIIYRQDEGFQITYGNIFFTINQDLELTDTFQLNSIKPRRIFKDKEQNIWIATESDGLLFLTANARNALTFSQDQKVLRVIGHKGTVFYSSGNTVYTLKQDSSVTFFQGDRNEKYIRGLAFDNKENLYIGGELNTYKVNRYTQKDVFLEEDWENIDLKVYGYILVTMEGKNGMSNIKDFYWDTDNAILWISTGMRFYKLILSNPTKPILKELPLRRARSVSKGNDGTLWAGGTNGLVRVTPSDTILQENEKAEILSQKIIAIEADQDSLIWVGTEGLGVYGYDKQNVLPIVATKGLFVSALFKDTHNHLWVASNKGVQQIYINPNNPEDNRLVKTYTTNDGLASNETNDIYVNSQYIFVATNKGLTRINRQQRYNDKSTPKLSINTITINGNPQEIADKYDLTYQENELEIAFNGLSYKSFKNIEYAYQLTGADEEWQVTKNRTIRYANLNPGDYVFQLKAKDITGKETKLEAPIRFTIRPPFWETFWFRGIILLGLMGIGYLIYKLRVGQIKKTAKVDQQFAELELQALRSQMNPHFVFNSLTSIQYFIQESDLDEADEYLAKFGKLMRLFLESSKTKYIPLDQEIKLLKAYIEMEQLRFEEKFEIVFIVENNVPLHYASVPSLLIQPFVENAINHGLFHKKEKGLLQLTFEKKEAAIITVTLTDNGIGRKQANKIKEKSIRSYKSRGLEIVEERLKAINRTENINIQYTIEDLEHDLGKSFGTRVILQIPILHNT